MSKTKGTVVEVHTSTNDAFYLILKTKNCVQFLFMRLNMGGGSPGNY